MPISMYNTTVGGAFYYPVVIDKNENVILSLSHIENFSSSEACRQFIDRLVLEPRTFYFPNSDTRYWKIAVVDNDTSKTIATLENIRRFETSALCQEYIDEWFVENKGETVNVRDTANRACDLLSSQSDTWGVRRCTYGHYEAKMDHEGATVIFDRDDLIYELHFTSSKSYLTAHYAYGLNVNELIIEMAWKVSQEMWAVYRKYYEAIKPFMDDFPEEVK